MSESHSSLLIDGTILFQDLEDGENINSMDLSFQEQVFNQPTKFDDPYLPSQVEFK